MFNPQGSYVYVFDGLPRFLGNGVVHSDHNLIGAFCGTTMSEPITVEATSGINMKQCHPNPHNNMYIIMISKVLNIFFSLFLRCDVSLL